MSSRCQSLLFIVSAPSGTGKTSVCKELLNRMSNLTPSISCTTRQPRTNEKNGVDYWFVSPEIFKEKIDNGEFAEWARVHSHLYGTPLDKLRKDIASGKDILLTIDVQGAEKLRTLFPQAVGIFLLPPSWEVLTDRLTKRKTNTKKDMEQRLNRAREEVTHCKEYDYVVINKDLEVAVEELRAIIMAERCRTANILPTLQEIFPIEGP